MVYDLAQRFDRLGTRMKQLSQANASYTRGATTISISSFTPQQIDVSELAMYGITLLTEKMLDVVFDTSKLFSLSPAYPVEGDTFIWGENTYQPMSIGDELYNFTTTSRLRIRVHLKQCA